ncbi:hypothetical protein DV738_g173, partial [Chaetothyriales sp. CBS 135597]
MPQQRESGSRSPSPSPPPEAPTTNTAGPRAARLQRVFAGALSSSIQSNSYANFSACFPTPAKYCPTALEGVWKQLNQRLQDECKRDFDKILEERSVVEGLNQWDALLEDARRRRDRSTTGEPPARPMHSLSADELYTARLTPFLQQAHTELQGKLGESQRENERMMSTIRQQQQDIESLMSKLEAVVKDLEGSVEAMTGGDEENTAQALKRDLWTIEQEVTATKAQ